MVGIGDLTGGIFYSEAHGVSDDGLVVVGYSYSASAQEAFIWDSSLGMRPLWSVLTSDYGLDLTGWTLASAYDISDDGRVIVGYGTHNGNTEAWMAVIPEPDSMVLVAMGVFLCAGALLAARRRRHAA